MQVVFFPEEFHTRAPTIMGHLRAAASHKWVTLNDVIETVRAGQAVTIRPASETELKRAEGYIALYDIGVQLAAHLGELLDQDPAAPADAKLDAGLDALISVDVGLPQAFDQASVGETLASSVAGLSRLETAEVLPELYAAMRNAYVAGDRDAVFSLDNQIQTILLGSAVAEVAIERARMAAE